MATMASLNDSNSNMSTGPACVTIPTSSISDLLMSIYIVAFVLGTVFHLLTLGPIVQQVRSHNVLGVYLLSLSVSDLLYLLTMPLWIYYYRMDHHWTLGWASCRAAGFIYYSNMYVSIYLLCCISLDRCLAVTSPLRAKAFRRNRYAWAVCVAVALLVMTLHVVILLVSPQDSKDDRCYETYPLTREVAQFNLLRVGLGFLAPLLLLAGCYAQIFRKVWLSHGVDVRVKRKVRLLSAGVIGIFSLCFGPYHLLLLLRSAAFIAMGTDSCSLEQSLHFLFACTLAMSSLNAVVDPVLYVLASNGITNDLRLCCRGQGSEEGGATTSLTQWRTRITSWS